MSKLLIAIDQTNSFRIYAIDTTTMIQKFQTDTQADPVSTLIGGKFLTAAILMNQMKKESKLILNLNLPGYLKNIIVEVTPSNTARLHITTKSKVLLQDLITGGLMQVTSATNTSKTSFNSQVTLDSENISTEITKYFQQSEQINTAVILEGEVKSPNNPIGFKGIIIQALPDTQLKLIDQLEDKIINYNIKHHKSTPHSLPQIIDQLFDKWTIIDEVKFKYDCPCSQERFITNLKILPKKDIIEIKKDKIITITCEFCKKKYQIKTEEI